jgi:membrane protein
MLLSKLQHSGEPKRFQGQIDVLVGFSRTFWAEIQRAQVFMAASSLAYTTILSFIPLLAVSFAIFQVFGGLHKAYDLIEPFILSNLAEGVSDQVTATLSQFIDNVHTKTVGVGGLIGLIFTSMSMLSSIERVINRIWNVPIRRGLFQRLASYWFFITLGPLALAVALGFAGTSNIEVSKMFFPGGTGIFLVTAAAFTWIYKLVPDTKVSFLYSTVAGLTTATCFSVARVVYQIYTSHFLSYNRIYGSLSAVPILLLWIYIVWLIVLGGAALGAALQRSREKSGEKRKQATLESP